MRLFNSVNLLPLLALTASWLPQGAFASVLAIDYGADFIKASLMKPGVPFDVLLNKDSKRKIHSTVAWSNGDRLFGQDAFNTGSRFPADTFSNLKLLQAVPFDSETTAYFAKISTVDLSETSRNTIALKRPDGTTWTVEELIAMQFAYIKHLAEEVAEEKVTDVVVTVPPYFTQFERDAVADAIEISGLKTLALINDGTAVAINYAMIRSFPTEETHIIYDAGASSIVATAVSFVTVNDKSGNPQNQITVRGVGYVRSAGGIELDRRLRDILIQNFQDKYKKDLRTEKRALARLWKETSRIKALLSLGNEATANVESIAWDIDFKSKVTRSQFEEACADLVPSFTQPIEDALRNAGLSLDDINSVILTGGSTRTPMIKRAVSGLVGEDKISVNVNADEAAVLGAGLHAASLSRQFKTKNMKVQDILVHDVQASYAATSSSANSRPRTITTVVFPAGSKTGTKKTLTFKRKEDFIIQFDYKNAPAGGFPTNMLEVELNKVTEAIANLTEAGAVDPVVKATVSLSESGFVSVTDAVAYGEIKDDSLTGKIKDFFGAGKTSTDDEATGSAENVPPRESATESTPSESDSATASSASPSPSAPPKEPVKDTIPLEINVRFTSIPPMTVPEKKASRSKLRAVDNEEAAKHRREEARNTLEGYLYRMRDLLDPENHDTPFKKCSQESERKAIEEKLEESFSWLHDRGDLAETSQLLDKRIALEALEKPIIHRYQEIEAFPQALNNSQKWNWSTRLFLHEARANLTAEIEADLPSKWTKDELDGLEKALKEHESWLAEWVEKQKAVKPYEDPVIETREMKARAKVLETHLQRLWKRKVPKAPKKKKVTSTTTTTSAVPTSTDGPEDAGEDNTPPKADGDQQQDHAHDEL